MLATKAQFYKLRKDLPDVCEGVDIPRYMRSLRAHFRRAAESLETLAPGTKLPGGTLYYLDTARDCFESPSHKKYELEDAISDCIRMAEKRKAAKCRSQSRPFKPSKAKRVVAKMIARKAEEDLGFREKLLAYNRVPQAWADLLKPLDLEQGLDVDALYGRLKNLDDRDFSHPTNAKGQRHPLARIMESCHFTKSEKIGFIADYMIGRKNHEAPRAVRIGSAHNRQEFNRARWLEKNGAYVLETVGDVLVLTKHFTRANRLQRGAMPELRQLEVDDLKQNVQPAAVSSPSQ